ncbi:flagellar protein FlaG [uncultured Deefgea sp.]|uniref:flagellar protein FlaG n=1 Tax=uncultured Deefgea sp. TaxID=1304914 RepID=UPI002591C835|nr:flagellar protein FlaG [uncultured Deefgea sp.]
MQINPVATMGALNLELVSKQTRQSGPISNDGSLTTSSASIISAEQGVAATSTSENKGTTDRESSKEERENAVKMLNDVIKASSNETLQFAIDDETDIRLVKLIDINTKETIRQFPSEEIVDIARAMQKLQGMMIRDKA